MIKNKFEYHDRKFTHAGVNYRILYDKESQNRLAVQTKKLDQFNPDAMQSNSAKTILAFWINVYNFYTITEIKRMYPISSMKKIGWDNPVVLINGKKLTLDDVEHKIIRPMGDPRIHFAVNCASVSCPSLNDKIFEGDKLDQQLDDLVINAFKNPLNLRIEPGFWGKNRMAITKIFYWFDEDFEDDEGIINFIHRYAPSVYREFGDFTSISYDWNLNSQKNVTETIDKLLTKINFQ